MILDPLAPTRLPRMLDIVENVVSYMLRSVQYVRGKCGVLGVTPDRGETTAVVGMTTLTKHRFYQCHHAYKGVYICRRVVLHEPREPSRIVAEMQNETGNH